MLELYYFENSICAERPLMLLAEKGVTDWVPRHVHLFRGEQFDPAYLALNPKAQVPTLVHDGAASGNRRLSATIWAICIPIRR